MLEHDHDAVQTKQVTGVITLQATAHTHVDTA